MLEIKPLAYDFSSLKPVMGSDTLFFHHEKHYAGYVNKANELIPAKWKHKSLKELICLARDNCMPVLFNQVAQVWNHEFFFDGLSLNSCLGDISDSLHSMIEHDFLTLDNLKAELVKAAISHFASGWVWLVNEGGVLKVQTTSNAETPCGLKDIHPLWTLDVWEHAYYLDYQNRRKDFAEEVVCNAINWRFVSDNLNV